MGRERTGMAQNLDLPLVRRRSRVLTLFGREVNWGDFVFHRLTALFAFAVVLALEMLIAFFYAHVPRGSLVPYVNGGELALLYASVWIFLAGNGAGPFSVDRTLAARKAVRR